MTTRILDTVRGAVEVDRRAGERAQVGQFLKLAQLTALNGSDAHSAALERATPKVQEVLRGLFAPIGTTGSGAALAEMRVLSEAFSTSLIGISVFDTLLSGGGMKRAPLNTRGAIITVAPVGGGVNQGDAKPISELQVSLGTLPPQKAWAALAMTELLFDFALPGAATLFGDELKKAVSRSTDAIFLSQIIAAAGAPVATSGTTFVNVLTDLGALLALVDVEPGSRLYFVMPTAKAKVWALMATPQGGLAFPELDVTSGGPLAAGVEALISDQLPANRMVLIVADGLIADSLPFELRQIRQGDINLSSTPDNPSTAATVMSSLWQHNMLALAVERWMGFQVIRARSVAALSY
jgi:hypothetical protein